MRLLGFIAFASLSSLFPCCDHLWPDVNWRSECYVAIAIDARGQMNLAFDQADGTTMALVEPTVFAIGWDDRHIVVKQHPGTDGFGSYNRAITNYFIIERTESPEFSERQKRVQGPLSEEEFQRLASSLKLPSFQKVFRDLQ